MLAPIKIAPPVTPGNSARLARELDRLAQRLTVIASADPSGAASRTAGLAKAAYARLKADPKVFASYETSIDADLRARLNELMHDLAPGRITADNLPRIVRDRFVGKTGRYLVQIYPRGDVWGDAALSRFVGALKTVDQDVTGPPVQSYTIAGIMRGGYEHAAVLALVAVFVFVFADFRNLRDTALATVPLLFGGIWLLEAMGLMGWEFNLANLFAVPVLIGTGVDNGVNMLYRWREERDKSALILTKAVGKSVTICSLTTIAGFAALIPAQHRGISSLGWVLSLGVALILAATLLVLPALFEILGRKKAQARIGSADAPEEESAPPRRAASGGLRR
jgi:predicted RND superfamily exporter protein